ncbi:MAG: hypothetical protein Q9184_007072, partial [Pyrenodesmia sp. 2 TL-2023]
IVASITTILTAAARVSNLLSLVHNAPASAKAILTEVEHVSIVFGALQRFIDDVATVTRSRAALINVEDITIILTQTVLVFSELQSLIASVASDHQHSVIRWRLRWARHEGEANRLMDQLQRQKTSFHSDLHARESADDLREYINDEVEADAGLAMRLEELQLRSDDFDFDTLHVPSGVGQLRITSDAGDGSPDDARTPQSEALPDLTCPEANHAWQTTYNAVLESTRVYNRVRNRDVDDMSTISSNRSRPWSILSGISMGDISDIAVVSLPLYEPELWRVKQLISPVEPNRADAGFNDETDNFSTWSNGFVSNHSLRAVPAEHAHLTKAFMTRYGICRRYNDRVTLGDGISEKNQKRIEGLCS